MDKIFSNEINILKALAILLVVSGHLEFSLLGMFTPYSFQLALFFFISGCLFKDKYLNDIKTFVGRRVKSLLVPYFLYNLFYLGVTILIAKLTGKFWGMPVSLKNFFITPFLNGHQFDLSCPMWFVTQLFMTMIAFLLIFKVLNKITNKAVLRRSASLNREPWRLRCLRRHSKGSLTFLIASLSRTPNKFVHLAFFTIAGVIAIPLCKWLEPASTPSPVILVVIRTMFSMFFVYLGYFYTHYIKDNYNIFTPKWLGSMIVLQSILWLFNRDYDPEHGIGLSYVLVWARFDEQLIVPVITSITGIWASLFTVKILYPYLKDIKFIQYMGKVTYHIMANHLLVMYIITAILLHLNNIPISERANHDIYWIYNPVQTTYFYFVITMLVTTYGGVLQQKLWVECKDFIHQRVQALFPKQS